MKAAYITLGCKVNQYDTDAMCELMEKAGYETVDFSEKADVYVINTCTVTNIADRKSRQMIRRAADMNPDAVVCVTGCLAQRDADAVMEIKGVDAVLGVNNRHLIVDIISQARENKGVKNVEDISKEKCYEQLGITSAQRTRAHIKIEDGCDNFCSYCIIPYTRGRIRSRDIEDIKTEAATLAANGVKEVVVTGIHISSYGKDIGNIGLLDVVKCLNAVDGIERIRLGSLEPTILTDEFCAEASELDKLCPHFHVSLQSGCDSVLKRMNRHYTAEMYKEYIENLRKYFVHPAITTDVIAGFNMETEEEHKQTIQFLKEIQFAKVHVFPYSERKGTAAVRMGGAILLSLRKQRAQELIEISAEMQKKYISLFTGEAVKVLFEEEHEGYMYGYTERYVRVRGQANPNEIKQVFIKDIFEDTLIS